MAKKANDKSRDLTGPVIPERLLGALEAEVMHFMWELDHATVQRIVRLISYRRTVAYTTVMTIMGHLVNKGLLTRTSDGKRYDYRVALTRDEFLRRAARERVKRLLGDFGELGFDAFVDEVRASGPQKMKRLKSLLERLSGEDASSS